MPVLKTEELTLLFCHAVKGKSHSTFAMLMPIFHITGKLS